MFDALEEGKFKCILADPPWRFRAWSETKQAKAASRHYHLMTTNDIAALPVARFADRNCILFLWATNPMLPAAFEVMQAWGFTYKTVAFTWAKSSRNTQLSWAPKLHKGLGYWTRANTETCLLGVKGKPKRLSKGVDQLIFEPIREHSRKPDEVHTRIERLCDGPRLELFGREERPGWTVRGDEVTKFNGSGDHGKGRRAALARS